MNLLGAPMIWASEVPVVRRLVTEHRLGHQLAGRFVAGDALEDGLRAANDLGAAGIAGILDHLGENVASAAQAAEATEAYVEAVERIESSRGLDCMVSVKLTQLGLDVATDLCRDHMRRVLESASRSSPPIVVMIDMEASRYVDRTLDVYLDLRADFPQVGVCVQAALRRTPLDVLRIAAPGAVVRVCKGAYLEPPDVAFEGRREVSTQFTRLVATLLSAGSNVHLATHDPTLIEGMQRYVRTRSISRTRYEFQMLYGVRRDLQAQLVRRTEPVRVYIPYGSWWYPYLTRRLAERPANVWFFVSNALRRHG